MAAAEGYLADFTYQWNKWATAVGRGIIDGAMVEEARSGEYLCSHASLDCLLNRIYFQVWLAFL